MRQVAFSELSEWIDAAAAAAQDLKKAIALEEIFVATSVATSSVPYSHLTKAFQVHEAILILCRSGFGSEAMALSRSLRDVYYFAMDNQ